jgi:hypothetical protein
MLTKIAHFAGPLLSFGACLLICSAAFAHESQKPVNPAEHSSGQSDKITMVGCLASGPAQFPLSLATEDDLFILTGQTVGLEQYTDREVSLEGSNGPSIFIDGVSTPYRSFAVTRVLEVTPKRKPQLDDSFNDKASWRSETLKRYGVKFVHPENISATTELDPNLGPNFVVQEGWEIATSFGIPGTAYADTDFSGGSLAIFVNRHLTNGGSCLQFGGAIKASSFVNGKLQYSESHEENAGMGTKSDYFYFHVFQHGLCYELQFELVTRSPRRLAGGTGCNVPLLSEENEWNLIRPLLKSVTFVRPGLPSRPKNKLRPHPRITEFSTSPRIIPFDTWGNAAGANIILSWAARGTDYVDFTYTCSAAEESEQGARPPIMILESQQQEGKEGVSGVNRQTFRSCHDFESSPKYNSYFEWQQHLYYSPTATVDASFSLDRSLAKSDRAFPISVIVTITPFFDGVAYRGASKSLTIQIR